MYICYASGRQDAPRATSSLTTLWVGCGSGVSLTLCCFVVYSTRRFVVYLSVCHFVLVFFSPFSIAITSLGEERANLSAFRTTTKQKLPNCKDFVFTKSHNLFN